MITVVICTRNRSSQLERCLRYMVENGCGAGFTWQLVVVDNASTDDTRAVIARFARSLPLHYAYEAQPGLSHARNRGVREARHPLIAFTDDDCLVGDEWLRAIVVAFESRPQLSIVGGQVLLADESDYPVSIRVHDKAETIATVQQILSFMSGCNMAFRSGVFDEVGLFDPAFGKGKPIGSAEDTDFLYRALRHGCGIAYLPQIVVRHAHGRDTPGDLATLTRAYVRGRGAFYCKFIADRRIAKMAYWEVRGLIREWVRSPSRPDSSRLLGSLAAGAFYHCIARARDPAAQRPAD